MSARLDAPSRRGMVHDPELIVRLPRQRLYSSSSACALAQRVPLHAHPCPPQLGPHAVKAAHPLRWVVQGSRRVRWGISAP